MSRFSNRVPQKFPELEQISCLQVDQPRRTSIDIMILFDNQSPVISGIHDTAVISKTGVQLGKDEAIAETVTIRQNAIIGGEGFGYFWSGKHQQKVPQLGGVQIEDDVEIGCNTCINRATFGMPRIRRGAKIDDLVQITHNNDIGEHSIIIVHAGLSRRVTVGKRVTLAARAK